VPEVIERPRRTISGFGFLISRSVPGVIEEPIGTLLGFEFRVPGLGSQASNLVHKAIEKSLRVPGFWIRVSGFGVLVSGFVCSA
jgi:hypothetical protein